MDQKLYQPTRTMIKITAVIVLMVSVVQSQQFDDERIETQKVQDLKTAIIINTQELERFVKGVIDTFKAQPKRRALSKVYGAFAPFKRIPSYALTRIEQDLYKYGNEIAAESQKPTGHPVPEISKIREDYKNIVGKIVEDGIALFKEELEHDDFFKDLNEAREIAVSVADELLAKTVVIFYSELFIAAYENPEAYSAVSKLVGSDKCKNVLKDPADCFEEINRNPSRSIQRLGKKLVDITVQLSIQATEKRKLLNQLWPKIIPELFRRGELTADNYDDPI